MKTLNQYLIIMGCLILGECISRFLNIPVPGNVLGMIILLVALLSGLIKLEQVEKGANTLIKYMSLFFVPVGAGIMAYFNIISKYAAAIIIATFASTFLVLLVTGHATQGLILAKKKGGGGSD
jgi:holin-like protein